jgi:BirA family transcriptional regulator, biotin operon repressor / biotin---[acetyl-CoA-carboxylase] ligase
MIGRPLYRLVSVTSTQDIVFRLAERGAPEGTAVVAEYQSGGQGRSGRAWKTPPGEALLTSILFRPTVPPGQFSIFSLLIGDAIATVLENLFRLRPALKWPNDILLDGRKVSGVLINTRAVAGGGRRVAVAGIGLNINSALDDLPPGATSIRAETDLSIDLDEVRRALFTEIERRYRAMAEDAIDVYIAEVNRRLWLKGDNVSIDDATRRVAGRLLRVEQDGSLLLDTPEGPRRIVSGELTRGPRRIGQ